MKTITFNCDCCGYYNAALPVVGWTDGAGYIIVTCPQCKEEHPTIGETE